MQGTFLVVAKRQDHQLQDTHICVKHPNPSTQVALSTPKARETRGGKPGSVSTCPPPGRPSKTAAEATSVLR